MLRGVEGVVYDDCTDRLMLFSCYVGGALMALIMTLTSDTSERNWVLIGMVVFWYVWQCFICSWVRSLPWQWWVQRVIGWVVSLAVAGSGLSEWGYR